jgi:O-antigen/teichoic acid export membrane protein
LSNIRLKYSGLVNFASRVISIATGLIFTIIVTRRLSEESFGTWQFYSGLLSYFTTPSFIINYWLIRDLGRGRMVAKSGVFFNSVLSLLSTMMFLMVLPIISSQVTIDMHVVYAFVLWIILIYHTSSLESVSQGVEPQVIGYGAIVFEVSKVVVGAVLVGYMRLLLLGAVLSVDLALLIQLLYYSLKLSKYLGGKFSFKDVHRWFGMSLVPLVSLAPGFVAALDVLVLTFITGSILPIAYVKVVNAFAAVIAFSRLLAIGLYPRLLSGGTDEDIQDSMELVLMFLIPMVLGQLILAEPLLYFFREEYGPLYNVLRAASLCYAVITLKNFFSMVIQGVEKIDAGEDVSWKRIAQSYLMKIPLIELTGSVSYIALLSIIVKILHDLGASPVLVSLSSVSCLLLTNIVLASYYFKLSRRIAKFPLNFSRISRFLISGAIMSIMLLIFYPESAKSEQIFVVIVSLIPVILLGIITYSTVLLAIDSESRKLLKNALKYLRVGKT